MPKLMALERRLTACVLLLLGAIPVLSELLPHRVDEAMFPLWALLGGAVAVALARQPALRWAGATMGAVTLVTAAFWRASPEGIAFLALAPVLVLILEGPIVVAAAALLAAMGGAVAVTGLEALDLAGLSGATWTDRVGQGVIVVWLSWLVAKGIGLHLHGRRSERAFAAARTIDGAVARDQEALLVVAQALADPGLLGPVRGQGLGDDALAIASRLDDRHVLLGWISGPPLSTLTAGWYLRAAAMAGVRDPQVLMQIVRRQLDEVIEPNAVRWLAVWDRRSGRATTLAGASAIRKVSLGPTGMASTTFTALEGRDALAALVAPDSQCSLAAAAPAPQQWATLAQIPVLGLLALALVWSAAPLWAGVAWLGGALTVYALLGRSKHRCLRAEQQATATLEDRIEVHDDVHHQLARLHGSLLPYEVEVAHNTITAHRLRGDVLDGTFADVFIDALGRGCIVAGEVGGQGIAARFLGTAAQVVARVTLTGAAVRDWERVKQRIAQLVGPLGRRLGYRARLRGGLAALDTEGHVVGCDSLAQIVRVNQTDGTWQADVGETASIDAEHRAYITPTDARPGPEDDAPQLDNVRAAKRVAQLASSGQWTPQTGTLASLFSMVFDGHAAPRHGTLIELRHTPPQATEVEGEPPNVTAA